VQAKGFQADVRDPAGLAKTLESVTETLGPIEVLQYSPLPHGTILFVNGGTALVEKDPEILAGILWDLHAKRDRFRAEVATG
jgi:hypothetical protein